MRMAMIGLGRMGGGMAARLLEKGHEVVAWNRSFEKARTLAEKHGATAVATLQEAVAELAPPRVVWMMLPSGPLLDEHIEALLPAMQADDVLIDGGNTHYKDDDGRAAKAKKLGIHYLDIGVSGGVWGQEIGYCMMIGGPREAYQHVEPLLQALAPEGGYLYCGPTGAGHFVKMVHNGIEYGMMQAYAEGFALMQHSPFAESLDFAEVSRMWNQGSVIRSWLLELAERAFQESPGLDDIAPWVEDSGEGRWTVLQAVESSVSAPVLTLALMERFRSRDKNSFSDRFNAALRNQFGGHSIKKR